MAEKKPRLIEVNPHPQCGWSCAHTEVNGSTKEHEAVLCMKCDKLYEKGAKIEFVMPARKRNAKKVLVYIRTDDFEVCEHLQAKPDPLDLPEPEPGTENLHGINVLLCEACTEDDIAGTLECHLTYWPRPVKEEEPEPRAGI